MWDIKAAIIIIIVSAFALLYLWFHNKQKCIDRFAYQEHQALYIMYQLSVVILVFSLSVNIRFLGGLYFTKHILPNVFAALPKLNIKT